LITLSGVHQAESASIWEQLDRKRLIPSIICFFNEVLNSLPSILRLNKSFDLRALFRIEPTSAVSELLGLVESLGLEREFFGALADIGISWKTVTPCSSNSINEEAAPSLSVLKNNRFELINLYLNFCHRDLHCQLERLVGIKDEKVTAKTIHELILGNFRSPVIQIIAVDKDNKSSLCGVEQEKWLSLEMTLLKANSPILIVLGWSNSVVQASELKMEMIIKSKPVAVISMSNKSVNVEALGKFLVELYRRLRVVEVDIAFEKAKAVSGLSDKDVQLSFSMPEAYDQLSPSNNKSP